MNLWDWLKSKLTKPKPPTAADTTGLLALINRERRRLGVAALRHDARLAQPAQAHAESMAATEILTHELYGTGPAGRAQQAGYRGTVIGETVALGFTPVGVLDGWLTSPQHRDILLSAAYRDVGLGRCGDWWCALFGRER